MSARLWGILICLPLAGLLSGSVHPTPAGRAPHSAQRESQALVVGEDWPGWRGPQRDGHSNSTGLLPSWPTGGPPLQWTFRTLGHGYSGPAVVGNRVFVLGTEGTDSIALCLDLASGRELWRTRLGRAFENPWGDGPRSTPTVSEDHIYVLTARGHLACLRAETGQLVWDRWLPEHFGGEMPDWGYAESPLVDGHRLIVTPGLETPMVALHKQTGEVLWTSRGMDDGAQYASIVSVEVGSQRAYVTMTDRGLVAVSAETGQLLCRYAATNNGTAVCPTPLVRDNYVFSTSGHGAGCGLVQLQPSGDGYTFREVYFHRHLQNHHGGVVRVGESLFGYSDRGGWTCQDFFTGRVAWQEADALERGSLAIADGRLYLLGGHTGAVVLLEPSNQGWREHGRLQLPEQSHLDRGRGGLWTHPVIAHGRLLIRDQEFLFAFDLRR